jgi:hypothetical protein
MVDVRRIEILVVPPHRLLIVSSAASSARCSAMWQGRIDKPISVHKLFGLRFFRVARPGVGWEGSHAGGQTFAAADRTLAMKMLRLAIRLILSGLLLLGLAAGISFASFQAGFNARCKTGNMSGSLTPDKLKTWHDAGFDWGRRAVMCSMGDFQVVTPNEPGGKGDMLIIRQSRPFLLVNDKETDLLEDSGQHLLFSLTRGTSERPSVISYSTYDQAKGAWIENFDFGADSTLDYRTTESNGRRVKREFRIGEQWLEAVQQDGRTGVVFDGRFMPVADAIKLDKSKTGSK